MLADVGLMLAEGCQKVKSSLSHISLIRPHETRDSEFTERIYRFLGRYVGANTAQEEMRPYGENTTDTCLVNALEWDVFDEA